MRNLLAVWREHSIDDALRGAWEAGVVLAGLSAGAMCWFGGGISMSAGTPEPVRGLGLVDGSLSVHLDGEAQRLPAYRAAVAARELPAGYAADDGAALLFEGPELVECVASRAGARVLRVEPDGRGAVAEHALAVRLLRTAGETESAESRVLGELRDLRAGGSRWK